MQLFYTFACILRDKAKVMKKMKKVKTIVLKDIFSDSISSRASVINLLSIKLDNIKQLQIDFSDILYISRSVAHQFLVEQKRLKEEFDLLIEFQNANIVLTQLFETVENSSNKVSSVKDVKSVNFSTHADLSKFLMTV